MAQVYVKVDARNIPEVIRELTALRRQVRALRRALEPYVPVTWGATTFYPQGEQASKRAERILRLTAPKEDKRG